jgi:hypothetical protein
MGGVVTTRRKRARPKSQPSREQPPREQPSREQPPRLNSIAKFVFSALNSIAKFVFSAVFSGVVLLGVLFVIRVVILAIDPALGRYNTGSKASSSTNIWAAVGFIVLVLVGYAAVYFGLKKLRTKITQTAGYAAVHVGLKKLRTKIAQTAEGNIWWICAVVLVCLSGLVLIADNIIYNVPAPKVWHEAVVFTDIAAIGTFLSAAAACVSAGVAVRVFRRSKASTAENTDSSGMSEAEYRFLERYMENIANGKLSPDQTSQIQAMLKTLRSSGKSKATNGQPKATPGQITPSSSSGAPKEIASSEDGLKNQLRYSAELRRLLAEEEARSKSEDA